MNRIKGILYAAVSSSTFGLAPFFSITLLMIGFSAFEVLSYRWGVASIVLTVLGLFSGCKFRLSVKDFKVVFGLSLLRAITSFSLIIAYQNIASGVASTIHFMYPLVVALAMMFFFREKKSLWVLFAVLISLLGAALLSLGELDANNGNAMVGLVAACVSVFSYAGYIIGVRTTRAVRINSTVCHGAGNSFLSDRCFYHFRFSFGNRRIYMADYSRTCITGYGYFQYHFSTGNKVCRAYFDIYFGCYGTVDSRRDRCFCI